MSWYNTVASLPACDANKDSDNRPRPNRDLQIIVNLILHAFKIQYTIIAGTVH